MLKFLNWLLVMHHELGPLSLGWGVTLLNGVYEVIISILPNIGDFGDIKVE